MAFERDVGSRFTGMIFLLRRIFPETPGGHLQSPSLPDFGFAIRRPRRG